MNPTELNEVIRLHGMWLRGEAGGIRANLSEADLSSANLSGANLSGANLSRANLSRANLSWANLSGANLRWANLSGANLSGANLSGANLSWANLSWANLRWANLSSANLSGANLRWANLSRANLSRAIGVLRLPVSDPRGYEYIAVWHGFDWRIYAACRNFNEAEARAHWLSDRYPGPASVKETMGCALDWLARQPKP